MKFFFLVFALVSTFAKADETVGAITETTVKAPNYSLSYNYYHYALEGKSTANTNIYKFGGSTVDLQLLTGVWMYSPKWTFVVFAPYIKTMVETVYEPVPGGINFKTKDFTEGFGDIRLMAMSPLWAKDSNSVLYDVAITLPTGSTDAYFTSSPSQRAAYNMQLGSGTPDLIGALNYNHNQAQWLSSARGQFTVRGGKNSHGYALGNELDVKLNSSWQFCPIFNLGVQGEYKHRGAVQGRDERYELFNNYSSAVAHGDGHQYYHGPQINWTTSLVAKAQTPSWKNSFASIEAGLPFWQGARNLDDIRLDINYWLAANLSTAF